MHVFAADWTAVFVFVLETVMGAEERDGNAHGAFVAVAEVGFTSYATKATFVAVEGFFGKVHPDIA